jgi:hypothetical protein
MGDDIKEYLGEIEWRDMGFFFWLRVGKSVGLF